MTGILRRLHDVDGYRKEAGSCGRRRGNNSESLIGWTMLEQEDPFLQEYEKIVRGDTVEGSRSCMRMPSRSVDSAGEGAMCCCRRE